MSLFDVGIGGNERKRDDANEGLADIPQNRTLMVEKLTAKESNTPEVVKNLKNLEEVFKHYNPNIDIEFETEDGGTKKENLNFKQVGDFGKKGLTAQSELLQDLNSEQQDLQRLIRHLKTNKILKSVLSNPDAKESYLAALNGLIQEIDDE